jgi:deoxyribodipyrimidine photo-lyase
MATTVNIFWFRRDLRFNDNAGLYQALKQGIPVIPIFIFDKDILDKLEEKHDRRVVFIHEAIQSVQEQMVAMGSSLQVFYGKPMDVFVSLSEKHQVAGVYTNHDYEPYAAQRDGAVAAFLNSKGISFQSFKDQVIFEKDEVMKDDGTPYTVFTPYSKKWKNKLNPSHLLPYPTESLKENLYNQEPQTIPSLKQMGFHAMDLDFPLKNVEEEIVKNYKEQRDYPSIKGTSRLSVHLRFGTISIRQLAKQVRSLSEPFLNELIWREFYQMILWNFPRVGQGLAFKPAYDFIEWRNDEPAFEKWCEGQTGYPIVDAGMRELNATGFMHNRVRMIVASFLCKHLLIDWRWGEIYFAEKLLDFDLASNNGGWQWAAGSGCDAAPYFRIFNPRLQTEKFDKNLSYIRKWVPEFQEFNYPKPIVDHDFARKRCLETYSKALQAK